MKKTDTLLKLASFLVFCAMVAYLAVYVFNRFVDPVQTALAVTATMTDSAAMSGLVVRDELLIKSDASYIDVVVGDGERVSAGQTVAVIYDSEEALERATRMNALAREIEDVERSLSRTGGVSAGIGRDESIYETLRQLSAALRGGLLTGADAQQSALASLLFRTDTTDATETYLAELRGAYAELSERAGGDTASVTVSQSGTFSTVVDGFEGVSPEYARELTPSRLREIIAADRTIEPEAIGKLTASYQWYYAAIVDRKDASRLEEGSTVRLSFGRYYSGALTARVVSIGKAESGERVVLFRMDRGFADMLAVRAVSAEIIYSEYTGLRVPLKGLYRYYAGYLSDADGAALTAGETVTLSLGGIDREVIVSEVGSASRYGTLPEGIEANSELDTRPKRRLAVFCWPWADEPGADDTLGGGTVTAENGEPMTVVNFYEHEDGADRMCVFTMTGLQAERKKVELLYAGDEYGLVLSEGDDALREGNDIIVQAAGLYNGKVFH